MDGLVNVLLVEDNPGDAVLIREALHEVSDITFRAECVDRLATARRRLAEDQFDVVLLDLSLPDGWGLDTFRDLHAQSPDVPVVVLTGLDDEQTALAAVHEGAQDYLVKGRTDWEIVTRSLRYAIERQRVVAELRNLNRMKSELVSTTSHELRTPLTAILGFIKTLDRLDGADDRELRADLLARAERQANRLLRLIEELLETAEVESGHRKVQPEPFSFAALAKEVIDAFDGAAVNLDVTASLPPLATDRYKIAQILTNLVDNALKFSEPRACTIAARPEPGRFAFSVEDGGIGMTQEQANHMFEPFWQADSSATRKFGGVGLGLHLVQLLTDLLGGTTEVDTAPGRGTRVTVTLPQPARSA